MKKYLSILMCALAVTGILGSCKSKPDIKTVRQKLLDQHDRLMMVGEQAMNLKIALDTLNLADLKRRNPDLDTAGEHRQISLLSRSLGNADDQMSDWMHNFKEDFKGGPEQDPLTYFSAQKVAVTKLSGLYQTRINAAKTYLKRFHVQTAGKNDLPTKM